jgi:phosphoribosylanthranilate isomerase
VAEVKFCGLTRTEDARLAVDLGAAYVGVVFAGGPRVLTVEAACRVLDGIIGVRRVGVFGSHGLREIARTARAAALDVIQLHGEPTPALIRQARESTGLEIWAVCRLAAGAVPEHVVELAAAADALLVEPRVAGHLGGTGTPLSWERLEVPATVARLVLAGGLRPENVARAIRAVRPSVVDVSSGVERSPGVKDPAAMRAFVAAVRSAAA